MAAALTTQLQRLDWPQALRLLRSARSLHLQLDARAYHGPKVQWRWTCELLRELKRNALEPTAVTLGKLSSGCGDSGWSQALGCLQVARCWGVECSLALVGAALSACEKAISHEET